MKRAAVFVQGVETAESNCWYPEPRFWLWSSCAKHPVGGSNAIFLNYSSPCYSYPAMQHPFSGICPSSSWWEEKYSWKTREGIGTKRGGRDRFWKVDRVRLSASFAEKYDTESDSSLCWSAHFLMGDLQTLNLKKSCKGVFQANRKNLKGNDFVVTVILTAAEY